MRRNLTFATMLALSLACVAADAPPGTSVPIDASTLRHKVLCGYQGWFRCPGDPGGEGWRHWSRRGDRIDPGSLTVEMWPDLAEFTDAEKYDAPGFTHPDGSQAHLFSSANRATVARHFQWMRQYGIDGAFVQRFLVNLRDPSTDLVLDHARDAAEKSGRVYAIGYDLSGMPAPRIFDVLTKDWKRLTDEKKITHDDRYQRHEGKPVVFVWGFFPDRFAPELAQRIIDFFHAEGPCQATLIGGCPWFWRTVNDPEWARVFRRFDVISPWNVGNSTKEAGRRFASTRSWKDDLAEANATGMAFLPVIYPGFGWTNLQGPRASGQSLPRLGGEFFWRQFTAAGDLGVEMAYVAMFDEVDEATAIFKVSNTPPTQAHFETFEGLPTDWYLRLTGEGSKVIRGERPRSVNIPIKP